MRFRRGAIQRQVPKRPHKPSSHLLGRRPLPRNQASAPTSAPVAATCSGETNTGHPVGTPALADTAGEIASDGRAPMYRLGESPSTVGSAGRAPSRPCPLNNEEAPARER
jgi:hypothetical protein